MCILKVISDKAMSAFEILAFASSDLNVNENTVYPILRRLHGDGLLVIEKKQMGMGAPRKYYHVTEKGIEVLEKQKDEFDSFISMVNKIMEG